MGRQKKPSGNGTSYYVRNEREVERCLPEDCLANVRGRGSHRVTRLPNNQPFTYYVTHGRDYPKGTGTALGKQLADAGLLKTIAVGAIVGAALAVYLASIIL